MNETVKLLLMSYVDGDLDVKEIAEAEDIIKNNKEALEYINDLKKANLEWNDYYKDIVNEDRINRLYNFTQSKILHKKTVKSKASRNFFTLNPFFNYVLTASLFLSIGLFYQDFIQDNPVSGPGPELEIFQNSFGNTKVINKTKSLLDIIDLSDITSKKTSTVLEEAINEMVSNLNRNLVLKYGNDSLSISILEQASNSKNISCYLGSVTNNPTDKDVDAISYKFKFCKSFYDFSMLLY